MRKKQSVKSEKKNKIINPIFAVLTLVLLAGLLFLNYLYVPECDELYFTAWRFDSVGDMLLSKPNTDLPHVTGLMQNGRLIGNFLGVLESRMYFSGMIVPRALLFTAGIAALALLAGRYASGRYSKSVFIAAALFICTPKGFYANVWSWGVSYVNYVLPFIGFLAVMILLEKKEKRSIRLPALFILALASQLFMETFTIAMCVCAVILLFYKRYPAAERLAAFAGFFSGAAVMFLDPRYRIAASGGAVHTFAFDPKLISDNITAVLHNGYMKRFYLFVIIGVLLLAALWKDGRKAAGILVFAASSAAPVTAVLIECSVKENAILTLSLAAVTFAAIMTGALMLKDKNKRSAVLMNLVLSAASLMPLVVFEKDMGERLYFPCYIFICLAVMLLLPEKLAVNDAVCMASLALCIAWTAFLMPVYRENNIADRARIAEGLEQIKKGAEEITLPLLPHPDLATNEHSDKGDLSFIVYRDEPFDVKITFVPYEDYYG